MTAEPPPEDDEEECAHLWTVEYTGHRATRTEPGEPRLLRCIKCGEEIEDE